MIKMPIVHLLDYVAGNVRSLVNAIEKVGYEVEWIRSPEDVVKADVSRHQIPEAAHSMATNLTMCRPRN